jgi:hypothetical protein
MGVKVSFLREDEPPQAAAEQRPRMLAPKTAVRQADGKSVVFVVRDDRVERRAVQVGNEDGDQVEVLSGLTSGDRIVVDAPPTLKDGDRIRIS